jgi:hypothetical protein
MTLYCPHCHKTDQQWKLAIPELWRDGIYEQVYRHICGTLAVAVMVSV